MAIGILCVWQAGEGHSAYLIGHRMQSVTVWLAALLPRLFSYSSIDSGQPLIPRISTLCAVIYKHCPGKRVKHHLELLPTFQETAVTITFILMCLLHQYHYDYCSNICYLLHTTHCVMCFTCILSLIQSS